ncbi:MFS transporter [Streptomyces sp. NA02950]|uniref:MFS transporter n=1 Tax=Streptomyces sp. NA02950 TaxID=2742137 RepID=UPI0034CF2B5E
MSPERAPRRWLTLAVLCMVLLTVVLDNAILFVAVPSLTRDLGATTAETQWMISAYSLAMGALLIAAGGLADRYGRRRALLVGTALFGLGSLTAAPARSPDQVVAARAGMGVGAAFLMSCTLAVIVRLFDDEERPRAIAIWTAVSSASSADSATEGTPPLATAPPRTSRAGDNSSVIPGGPRPGHSALEFPHDEDHSAPPARCREAVPRAGRPPRYDNAVASAAGYARGVGQFRGRAAAVAGGRALAGVHRTARTGTRQAPGGHPPRTADPRRRVGARSLLRSHGRGTGAADGAGA